MIVVAVLLSGHAASAEEPEPIALPEDPKAEVLAFRQELALISILRDGTVRLWERDTEPRLFLEAPELQALMAFVVREQAVFDIDAHALNRRMKAARKRRDDEDPALDFVSIGYKPRIGIRVATAEQRKVIRIERGGLAPEDPESDQDFQRVFAIRNRLWELTVMFRSRNHEAQYAKTITSAERPRIKRVEAAARAAVKGQDDISIGAVLRFQHPELKRRAPHLHFFMVEHIAEEVRKETRAFRHTYKLAVLGDKRQAPALYERMRDVTDIWHELGLVAQSRSDAEELHYLHRLVGKLASGNQGWGYGHRWRYSAHGLWQSMGVPPRRRDLWRPSPLRVIESDAEYLCVKWTYTRKGICYDVVAFKKEGPGARAFQKKLGEKDYVRLASGAVETDIERHLKELAR